MTATTTTARGEVSAEALSGPSGALRVIEKHLASNTTGRCAACQEWEPCSQTVLPIVGSELEGFR